MALFLGGLELFRVESVSAGFVLFCWVGLWVGLGLGEGLGFEVGLGFWVGVGDLHQAGVGESPYFSVMLVSGVGMDLWL